MNITPEGQKEIANAFDEVAKAIEKLRGTIRKHGLGVKPSVRIEMQMFRASAIDAAKEVYQDIDFVTIAMLPLIKEGSMKIGESVRKGIDFKNVDKQKVTQVSVRADATDFHDVKLGWGA